MNYSISTKANSPYSKNLEIEIVPKNDVLVTFLISLDIKKLGLFLKKMALSESYYQAHQSAKSYKNLDWEDLEELKEVGGIKEDEIAIYHEVLGDLVIKESLFDKIVLEYAFKHLEVYSNNPEFPDNWFIEVKQGIEALRKKINSIY